MKPVKVAWLVKRAVFLASSDLAIAGRLARVDTDNAQWQRDLAISHVRVGQVLMRRGKRELARAAFRNGRVTFKKLIAISPTSAQLMADLTALDALLAKLKQ